MPDIFISYAHEDQERVRPIVKELEKRWSVFWDKKIPPGKTWEDSIGKALEESPCVLVVWSHSSVKSDWVKEEADVAKKRDTFVPLFLDKVDPPMGFRRIHAADLSDWKNDNAHQGFQLLIGAIESKISPATVPVTDARPVSKPETVSLEGAGHTSPQRKPERQPIVNVSWVQKNQLVIVVAVVMLVILGVVWSMKQPSPKVENNSVSPIAEAVKGNPEADTLRKAEAARLTAEKEAAVRREAEAVKARQDADARRKAEDARLKAEKDAARREADAVKVRQDKEANRKAEAVRLNAEKEAATREAKAKEKLDADARREAKAAKMRADKETAARQIAEAGRLKAEKETVARREAAVVTARQEATAQKMLKIGDEYGGGKIAWLDATGQHGLIAAKADLPGRDIYTWEAAKKACRELVNNGYSDWYLPTKDELNKLYNAKSAVGGFSDYYYWGSTEVSADDAWSQGFGNGGQGYDGEYSKLCVRAVRAF
jgi:hypothetical protein